MEISLIIPSRNERFLNRTIQELTQKMESSDYEIIVILDGRNEERIPGVRYIYNPESKGMRTAINQGVALAEGRYIIKLDAHCMIDKGMDLKLIADHQPNWVQIPRRKRLDAHRWELTDLDSPDVDYMFIGHSFRGHKDNKKNRDQELKKILIDEIEIFQGSCYFMERALFHKLGLLDDVNFGKMGSEALEIAAKCRNSGGKVMVNKKTWYAHAHIGRCYGGSLKEREKSFKYARKIYGQDNNLLHIK